MTFKVLYEDDTISTRRILVTLSKNKEEEEKTYVIAKEGGSITLDCSDLNKETVQWSKLDSKGEINKGS